MSSSSYLISATLVFVALWLSNLNAFFCQLDNYIWGVFFLIWLYSLFNVVESVRPSRASSHKLTMAMCRHT
ncbi:hypothetical protein PINS_up013110 [Pythium insidiosum]|nr:hypothetical protein PINS_up013110 [Pythium insidiosum]